MKLPQWKESLFSGSTHVASTSSQPVVLVSKTVTEALVYPCLSVTTITQRLFTSVVVKDKIQQCTVTQLQQQIKMNMLFILVICTWFTWVMVRPLPEEKKDNTSTLFLEQLIQNRCFKQVLVFLWPAKWLVLYESFRCLQSWHLRKGIMTKLVIWSKSLG